MNIKSKLLKLHFYESIKRLLEHKKLKDITIKDICDESGLSRTTFYRYFLDKNDLINSLFDELIKKEVFYNQDDSDFFELTRRSLVLISKNKDIILKLFEYHGQNSFEQYYSHGIKKAMEEEFIKFYKVPLIKDHELIIDFYTAGVVKLVKDWLDRDCDLTPIELTNLIINCFPNRIKKVIYPE